MAKRIAVLSKVTRSIRGHWMILFAKRLSSRRTRFDVAAGQPIDLTKVEAQRPLRLPGKIICISLNYRDHAAETGWVARDNKESNVATARRLF
jgi:2-keto-4-pentenoate hydratase/2-oxohepta-3-ene-1,7-dioic acid hydratase in catechol pathway